MSGILACLLLILNPGTSLSSKEAIDQFQKEIIDYLEVDLDSCLLFIDQSIQSAKDINYPYGEAYGLYLKGYVYRVQNELGKSFLVNLNALNILETLNDEKSIDTKVRLYLNTGEILKKHFKYTEAIQYYEEGLSIAKNHDLKRWVVDLNYNIGYAYQASGNLTLAITHIQEAYNQAIQRTDEHTIVNSLNLMGLILKDNGDYDMALTYFQKMLDYEYKELKQHKYRGRALHNMGLTYNLNGQTAKAEVFFKKSLEEKLILNRSEDVFITQVKLAEFCYEANQINRAKEYAQACLNLYDNLRLHPDHYLIFDLYRKISFSQQKYELTEKYADRYVAESSRFINQQEELIKVRDQFKMELLTASFLGELERDRKISSLTTVIIYILVITMVIFLFLKVHQIWAKRSLVKGIRDIIEETT